MAEAGAEPEEDRYEFERNEVIERQRELTARNQQQQIEWGRQAAIRYHLELLARDFGEIRHDLAARPTTTKVVQPTYVATEAKEGEETCIICMENVPDSIFDCGNKGFCCVCADKLLKTTRKCPLCRKTVTAFRVEKPEVEDLDDIPVSWEDFCT
jgi:hypothetical protein